MFLILKSLEVIRDNQRRLEAIRGHQEVKYVFPSYFHAVWVESFHQICIKAQLKCFQFQSHYRSLELIRGHYEVKHVFSSYFHAVWVESFYQICIIAYFKCFQFQSHQRSLVVIRGNQRQLGGPICVSFLFSCYLGCYLSLDMHKSIV